MIFECPLRSRVLMLRDFDPVFDRDVSKQQLAIDLLHPTLSKCLQFQSKPQAYLDTTVAKHLSERPKAINDQPTTACVPQFAWLSRSSSGLLLNHGASGSYPLGPKRASRRCRRNLVSMRRFSQPI